MEENEADILKTLDGLDALMAKATGSRYSVENGEIYTAELDYLNRDDLQLMVNLINHYSELSSALRRAMAVVRHLEKFEPLPVHKDADGRYRSGCEKTDAVWRMMRDRLLSENGFKEE